MMPVEVTQPCPRPEPPLISLKKFTSLLTWSGFLPVSCHPHRQPSTSCSLVECITVALPFVNSGISLMTLILTTGSMYNFKNRYGKFRLDGMWHWETVMLIIGGMKPLQCLINFLTISIRFRKQREMWRQVDYTNRLFTGELQIHNKLRQLGNRCAFFIIPLGLLLFLARLLDIFLVDGNFPENAPLMARVLLYTSPLLVVLLNIWVTLPLLYFHILSSLLRRWATKLSRQIEQNAEERKPLEKYFECFSSMAEASRRVDSVFNLFLLLSTLRSVAVMCMTLYFLTELKSNPIPVYGEGEDVSQANLRIVTNMMWGSIDIFFALFYLTLISWDGAETNRSSRAVLDSVLTVDGCSVNDRFNVFLFTQKVASQYSWGISAWRAFPIERSFALTLCSAIMTYFILIWRLKSAASRAGCDACCAGDANTTLTSAIIT